jgi:protein-S-isoprenylcysteine O-methyltransferase Ste14
MEKRRLFATALARYLSAFLVLALLLFLPAGDLGFWNAWLYLASLFLPMAFAFLYFLNRDPALLERRMRAREKEGAQKIYVLGSIAVFLATFALPGLDYRFGWSRLPLPVVATATLAMLGGYALFIAVMMQNSYASRVVEVEKGQELVATGLYSVVRHPMYLAASIIFLASPLVLGSLWAVPPVLLFPLMLVMRLRNEEKVLAKELPGYEEYMKKVRRRLIPFVW